jgi:hypothetical protein
VVFRFSILFLFCFLFRFDFCSDSKIYSGSDSKKNHLKKIIIKFCSNLKVVQTKIFAQIRKLLKFEICANSKMSFF